MYVALFAEPPKEVGARIRKLQVELSKKTGSKWNINFPPHITMRSGLVMTPTQYAEAMPSFQKITSGIKAPTLKIKQVSACHKQNWIGLDVAAGPGLAKAFQRLNRTKKKYDSFPKLSTLKAHISLAFNDLDEAGLAKAEKAVHKKRLFNIVGEEFVLKSIAVFVSDDRKKWVLKDRLAFKD